MTAYTDAAPEADGNQEFPISVNDVRLRLAEPLPDGGGILDEAGCRPPEDHVLIQLLFPGTRSVGLNESVNLHQEGHRTFRAFKSDRVFRFTIDGRGYEWGAAEITERELRHLAAVDPDETLALERGDEEICLAAGATVELSTAGTERLCIFGLVTVTLNNEDGKKIRTGAYTTEELIRVLGVEAGYVLTVMDEQGKLSPLQPEQTIQVRACMRFYSHVPAGGSS